MIYGIWGDIWTSMSDIVDRGRCREYRGQTVADCSVYVASTYDDCYFGAKMSSVYAVYDT